MPDQNDTSLPTGAVPPPLVERQPVENEKIEPCPRCGDSGFVCKVDLLDERASYIRCNGVTDGTSRPDCWIGAIMPSVAEAIAERDKRIATLEINVEAALNAISKYTTVTTAEVIATQALRAALEGKEAPRG